MSTQASTSAGVNEARGRGSTEYVEDSKIHFRVCRFIIETGICNSQSEMFRDVFLISITVGIVYTACSLSLSKVELLCSF